MSRDFRFVFREKSNHAEFGIKSSLSQGSRLAGSKNMDPAANPILDGVFTLLTFKHESIVGTLQLAHLGDISTLGLHPLKIN